MVEIKVWEPADEKNLTPSVIFQIAWQIREGKQDPDQARRLLRHFVEVTESDQPHGKVIPRPLLEFLRSAFAEYLKDPNEGRLERLLGLVRPKERPAIREGNHHKIARDVLRERLSGKTLNVAADFVAEHWHMHQSRIKDIWAKYKFLALDFEAASRALASEDKQARWTEAESKRLRKIYLGYVR